MVALSGWEVGTPPGLRKSSGIRGMLGNSSILWGSPHAAPRILGISSSRGLPGCRAWQSGVEWAGG
eukprot:11047869-Alexandrium_andersonii.AAC.1